MPPKVSTKAIQKKQAKIVEDKTFGLKNKNKSKKVQQYVQQVQKNVAQVGKRPKDLLLEQQAKDAKLQAKKAKEESAAELASLFKAVTGTVKQQEVAADVDPKSVLCAYFKAGTCRRGDKCKYSHDVEASRKVSKINLYADPRSADTMDNWDQAKLESVIASKQVKKPTETDIVCKYFLDAVEKKQYGWFWECPNGAVCHYRHALPPGFVLKTQLKEEAKDEEEAPDIGEQIEEERAQLDLTKCTPVTLESFTRWKEEQKAKRVAEAEEKAKAVQKRTGRMEGLTGRDLFIFDPTLFVDDEEAAAEDTYEIQETDWNAVEETSGVAGAGDDDDAKSDGAWAGGAPVGDASLFLDDDALPEDEEEEQAEEEEETDS